MPDIDAVIDSWLTDCCEQMKTENMTLKAEMAESLSQLAVRSLPKSSLCACVCICHVHGWIPFPPLVCKSIRSEVDKLNQLLVLHHFL